MLVDGARFLRRIVAQPEVAAYIDHEIFPGATVTTDAGILEAAVKVDNNYHGSVPAEWAATTMRWSTRCCGYEVSKDCASWIARSMPTQVSSGVYDPVLALAWRAAGLMLDQPASRWQKTIE